jgi:pimeloyl-ACP methyl ester carboxylesterase
MRRGGSGDGPALLLLHGLGATGEVWDGLTAVEDPAALLPLIDRLAASAGTG